MATELGLDPVVRTAALLADAGLCTPDQLLARYSAIADRVALVATEVVREPRFTGRAEVMAPLTATEPEAVARTAAASAVPDRRREVFGATLPEDEGPLTLAGAINRALADVLATHDHALLFGEDVADKGGVYGLTRGLLKRFGRRRVFDTLLDEQAILGLALGAGLSGLLPIPEIQYLAYLHNAEDQIRGEGASQAFFSAGSYRNPMVVRVAGYGYQQGFGGHFHNDEAVAVLRDIPGILVATPALPDDAGPLLRACVGAALAEGRVCVFLEPIALYHQRDLHAPGDGEWLRPYAGPDRWAAEVVPVGAARVHGDGDALAIVTYGNGVRMSLRVAQRLAQQGVHVRVVDLRWLAPLPVDDVLRAAEATGRVLVADETRRSGGVAEGVLGALVDAGFTGPMARVASADSYIPLGAAADLVLLSEAEVESAAAALVARAR
jgi:2-oxoisovalerate dehydrogenase E1 component